MFKILFFIIGFVLYVKFAHAADVENMTMEDMGTFMIEKLNLTAEESKESADQLYEKGMQLYNTVLPQSTVDYQGSAITYSPSTEKKESMKYLIASGMLGNPEAAIVAMKYLNFDGFIQGGKEYRMALAKILSDNGYLYGTYVLGLNYVNVDRNRDLALHYLGIVKDYCKNRQDDAIQSLEMDNINDKSADELRSDGIRRCKTAEYFYRNVNNQSYSVEKPTQFTIQRNREMKEMMNKLMIDKENSALEEYKNSQLK